MKAIFKSVKNQKSSLLGFNLKNIRDLKQKHKHIEEVSFNKFPFFTLYDDRTIEEPIVFCSDDKESVIDFIKEQVSEMNLTDDSPLDVYTLVWYTSPDNSKHIHLMSFELMKKDWTKHLDKI